MLQAGSIGRWAVRWISVPMVIGVAALIVACGSKDNAASGGEKGGAGASSAQSTSAKVTDIRIGKKMDASKQVSAQTDIFAQHDTIFAAVHTTGAAPNTEMTARWTFQDGEVVDNQNQPVTPPADAWNGFRTVKSGGLPAGTYTLHVLLNGTEVQKRDVMVK
jgi:hypothetical protein